MVTESYTNLWREWKYVSLSGYYSELLTCNSGTLSRVEGRFIGLFQHCARSAYCILTLNNFPHSSPEAPRIIQMRETSTSEGGNYYQ